MNALIVDRYGSSDRVRAGDRGKLAAMSSLFQIVLGHAALGAIAAAVAIVAARNPVSSRT
jgi:hypothetical protein